MKWNRKKKCLTHVGLSVAMINVLEAIAKTWYNLPMEGANASDLMGSEHMIDWDLSILE